MIRILRKDYSNCDGGIFKCIAHKERVLTDLFEPWIRKHPEFKWSYVITIGEIDSTLLMVCTDDWQELVEFNNTHDTEGSSGTDR